MTTSTMTPVVKRLITSLRRGQRGLAWAKNRIQEIRRWIRRASKRRAGPPWSLPLGLWWMVFHPCRRLSRRCHGAGYGAPQIDV
eukprot:1818182-Pyramimonas_sp.AAC.1